eukprot:gnl/MRDRNA2_/MRDRNA2_108842_c0_seq1.p1 gnl/MRDRNA2_/MRDRNA2_108842_c0~~gnl/MRDRNA2_/MRDRNA2_108842_c0_seq1.p1  ORF type:complete len:127 (+),score=17.16 gnl/MRDRNA2_/MRDRNA2_108842_c0_seq1:87-467(+)
MTGAWKQLIPYYMTTTHIERWPWDRTKPYPFGTKDEVFSLEEIFRNALKPGLNPGMDISWHEHDTNGHWLGKGIIAPPPCSPQPACLAWEKADPWPLSLVPMPHPPSWAEKHCSRRQSRKDAANFL